MKIIHSSTSSKSDNGCESGDKAHSMRKVEKGTDRYQKVSKVASIQNKTVGKSKNNSKSTNIHGEKDISKISRISRKNDGSDEKNEDVKEDGYKIAEQKYSNQRLNAMKSNKSCSANMQNNLSVQKIKNSKVNLACNDNSYNSNSLFSRINGFGDNIQEIFDYDFTNRSASGNFMGADSVHSSSQARFFQNEFPAAASLYQRYTRAIRQHLHPSTAMPGGSYEDPRPGPIVDHGMVKTSSRDSNDEGYIADGQKRRMLAKPLEMRAYEAALGILKLRRIFKDGTYHEWGYKYKSDFQIKVLTDILKTTPYPRAHARDTLAILLSLNPRSIQIWFQNARQSSEAHATKNKLGSHRIKNHIDTLTIIEIYFKNLDSRK